MEFQVDAIVPLFADDRSAGAPEEPQIGVALLIADTWRFAPLLDGVAPRPGAGVLDPEGPYVTDSDGVRCAIGGYDDALKLLFDPSVAAAVFLAGDVRHPQLPVAGAWVDLNDAPGAFALLQAALRRLGRHDVRLEAATVADVGVGVINREWSTALTYGSAVLARPAVYGQLTARGVVRSWVLTEHGIGWLPRLVPGAITSRAEAAPSDPFFGSGSVIRRVHGERLVGLWALLRAAALQAADPRTFAIFAAHTGPEDELFRRLAGTASQLELVFSGSRAQAEAIGARTRQMHARMRGTFPDASSDALGAAAYAADEPALLLWVMACLAESAQVVFERYIRRLSDDERERYWQEYLRFGELFGLRRADAPADYDSYRAYVAERVARSRLLDDARAMGRRVVLDLPVPARHRPARAAAQLAVVGTLPPNIREDYGFRWTRAHERAFRAQVGVIRAARSLGPEALWHGSTAFAYRNVASAERRAAAK